MSHEEGRHRQYSQEFQNFFGVARRSERVITEQPTSYNRMPYHPFIGGNTGFDLTNVQVLIVKQEVEPIEMLFNYETNNRYKVLDPRSRIVIFRAEEETDEFERWCFRKSRPFVISLYHHSKGEVIRIRRLCGPATLCPLIFKDSVRVEMPPTNYIGSVDQKCGLCWAIYTLKNDRGLDRLKITGPCWSCPMTNHEFTVSTLDGHNSIVARISKLWSGLFQETYTDADDFTVEFFSSVMNETKAMILASVFVIDFHYYENNSLRRPE